MTASAQGCAGRRKITKALRSRIKSHIIKKNHDSRSRKPPEAYSGNHERRRRVLLWEESVQPLGRDSNTDFRTHDGVCIFQFRKKDGQIRRAAWTLSQEVIDRYREESDTYVPKRYKKKARPTSTAYFDLEKGEFRCFLWENFLGMESDYCI